MFKIGQEVVCIKSHSEGVTVEGQIYIVEEIKKCKCCGNVSLHLGIVDDRPLTECIGCGKIEVSYNYYQNAKRFRPLDDLFNEEIREIMNTRVAVITNTGDTDIIIQSNQ